MKIVHLPIEIAGQIGTFSGALEKLGHFSRGFNFFSTYLGYKDYLLNIDAFEMGRMFEEAMRHFDLFHYHYGLSVYPQFKDIELLRNIRKPVVMHHWGNDVRMSSMATLANRYVYTGDSPPEANIRQMLTTLGQFISDAIVQDEEVLPYVQPYYKRVHVVPLAIHIHQYPVSFPSVTETNPLVLHAPTNQEFKGTAFIEKAVEALQKEIPFRYMRIEKMPHQEASLLYRQADIVIDQILCGSYGLLSVEAMAYGKPVIAHIRPDLAYRFGEALPICSANPDTIYEVLGELLRFPQKRLERGIAGRQFVERHHDSDKIAQQLLGIYEQAIRDA
jgi:hypothetical protein